MHHGLLVAFWGPAGGLLGACWGPTGSLLGAYWEPTGGLLGAYWEPTGPAVVPLKNTLPEGQNYGMLAAF